MKVSIERGVSAPVIFALAFVSLSCSDRRAPLPVYGRVGDFALTAETGLPFSRDMLKGKIWVADFIFTTCTGPCPRMSSQMARIQRVTPRDVALVSFTVDPARDTPEVLKSYAARFKADPERWRFLTGPQPMLHDIARNSFKLSDVDGSLNHSTRFVLVDRGGQIRGYYGTEEAPGVEKLLADIDSLIKS